MGGAVAKRVVSGKRAQPASVSSPPQPQLTAFAPVVTWRVAVTRRDEANAACAGRSPHAFRGACLTSWTEQQCASTSSTERTIAHRARPVRHPPRAHSRHVARSTVSAQPKTAIYYLLPSSTSPIPTPPPPPSVAPQACPPTFSTDYLHSSLPYSPSQPSTGTTNSPRTTLMTSCIATYPLPYRPSMTFHVGGTAAPPAPKLLPLPTLLARK